MNNNKKTNWYTQGQRLAARVLFIVWLLGICGLGNVLAAPKGKEVTAVSVSEAKPGSLWERLASRLWSPRQQETHRTPAGPVAEGVTEDAIKAISDRDASNVGDLDTLLEAATDRNYNVLLIAVKALGQLGNHDNLGNKREEVLDALKKVTQNKHYEVRQAAVEGLGEFAEQLGNKREEVLDALKKNMKEQDKDVRQAAVEALGKIGAQLQGDELTKVLEALQTATQDQNEYVLKAAVKVLGQLLTESGVVPTQDAVDALIVASKIPPTQQYAHAFIIRRIAVEALGKFFGKLEATDTRSKILTALQTAIQDEERYVRDAAKEALRNLAAQLQDKERKEVLDALQEVADKDEDEDVRKAAERAIAKFKEEPSAS